MLDNEKTLLTDRSVSLPRSEGLSAIFTILCIVDLFGVFPVIVLPKAVVDCGIYGIPIVIFIFCVQIYSAILLGRCWSIASKIDPTINEKKRYPYAAVAELAYGKAMSNLVTVILDATVFGAGIPNLLVASQNLQLFGAKMSAYQFDFTFCWWLVIIGVLLCPVMWLGSPKDMKSISILSVVFVCTVTIMTCYCIVTDEYSMQDDRSLYELPSARNILAAYGIIAFQFDIHPMLMTIQVDMKDSSKIGYAIMGGFLVTTAMFAITTALATYRYGYNISSNILQGLPASIPLYLIVLLVTFQLCLSSAVGTSPLFQHIEDKLNIPRSFNVKRCLVRSSVVAFGVFLGETVPRFDLVMSLIGSTLTGPLMFIFPPLLYGRLLYLEGTASTLTFGTFSENKLKIVPSLYTRITLFAILISIVSFGAIATSISTFYNWSNVITYAQFTPSCLLNITTHLFTA